MAGSSLIEVAEAVKVQLNATTFSQSFTAVRKSSVHPDLKDLADGLNVFVVPVAERSASSGRKTTQHEYDVAIGIAQHVTSDANSVIDPLTLLSEEISDFLRFETLTGRSERWIKGQIVPYMTTAIREQNLFLCTITMTFIGTRPEQQ